MVDESGDHPKDVEHSTHANISLLTSSTPTSVSSPVSSPDMSVPLSLDDGVSENDEIDCSSTGIPCKPEDLPKGVPCDSDSDDESGDHPKDVEHSTHANISLLTSSTPTAVRTPDSSPDMSVPLSLDIMVDESGDHPKDVEHSSPAAINISSSTLTATVSTPVSSPEDSDDGSDWSWSGSPSKPEDLPPKGVPCDLDSDDEYENSEEYAQKWSKYSHQVKESEGFDIEEYVFPGLFQPLPDFKKNKEHYDRIKEMAHEALKTFNDDSGKKYEFVDVEKVVWTPNLCYYLTIKAKQIHANDDDVKMIQAIVHFKFHKKCSIKLCRFKPDELKK